MNKIIVSLLIITSISCSITSKLIGSADLGDTHVPPFGHKTDCQQWKTEIEKGKKSPEDIKTLKHHFETQNCDEKLKPKSKK